MSHLKLFGYPNLTRDGAALSGRVAQRHRIAFLTLLAVEGPRGSNRERIMAMLWPESDPESARNLLKVSVYVLRRALGQDALLSDGEDLRLNPERVDSDLAAFEDAVERGDHARAVSLYGGPFLDGFFLKQAPAFERWVDVERERASRAYLRAVEALAADAEARGDLSVAVEWWARASAESPYDSRIALRLMHSLEAQGNLAGALQHAGAHAMLLRSELGIVPSRELTVFVERLRATLSPGRSHDEASVETGASRREPFEAREAREVEASSEASASPSAQASRGAIGSAPPFRLVALGGLGLRGPQGFVTGTTENERNALLLLAVLSAAGDSGVPRETLLLYFWPELPWREADASLEGLVREIRRWTHESVILGTDPLRVDPEVVGSDVGDLELAATQGRAEDVVALGHGFFLAGLGENVSPELDAWVKAQRRRLDDLWEHATERARAVDERIPEAAALGPGKGRGWTWPWAYGFAGVALAVVTLFVARAQLDVCAESAFLPTDDLARESTSNAAARDLYDQGMNPLRFRTDSVGRVSLNYFLRAVELDPDYLGAYIELASMYTRLAAPPGEGRVERLARGEQHARKALALNGCVAGAHLALGWVLLSSYRFAEAEESLLRTLELDPSANGARQLLGQLLIFRGRFEEQLALALQAREHDPVAPTPVNEVARGHMLNGRCGDALRWLDIIRDVHPPLLFTVYIRAECLRQQGRWEEAIDLVRGAVPAGESAMLSGLGFTLAQASQTASMVGPDSSQVRLAWAEEALVIRDMLLQRVSRGMAAAEEVALVYVGLGELDLAFEWLEKAIEERTLRFNVMEPPYRALHGDPRFDSLLASLGLPPRLR